jgi:hypothetical protein
VPVGKIAVSAVFALLALPAPAYGSEATQNASLTEAQTKTEQEHQADLNLTRDRAVYQHRIDDLFVLFPENFTQPKACYQTAVSNYVDDQLSRSDFMGYMKFTKPVTMYLAEDSEINSFDWNSKGPPHTDADLSARLSRIAGENQISPQELAARVAQLNDYVASCGSKNPAPWSVVGVPFSTQLQPLVTGQKLSFYDLMMGHFLAYHLPKDERGYVGCVYALTYPYTALAQLELQNDSPCDEDKKCVESILSESKEHLLKQLDELKAHQCTLTYAFQMLHH